MDKGRLCRVIPLAECRNLEAQRRGFALTGTDECVRPFVILGGFKEQRA
jgi:hypothetical protein